MFQLSGFELNYRVLRSIHIDVESLLILYIILYYIIYIYIYYITYIYIYVYIKLHILHI